MFFSSLFAVIFNLLLVYITYFIARVAYYFTNYSYFAETASVSSPSSLFQGSLVFDSSAIFYTNVLYIVMMLFPLHYKETKTYHKCCKWIFVVVNSIALAMNLADAVYFQYTMRRTTSTVFNEFSNENNLAGIFGQELINHWYLVLLALVIIFALWKLYKMPAFISDRRNAGEISPKSAYYVAMIVSLLVMTPVTIGSMRGGLTGAVRPITINNANQYAARPIDCALILNTPFSMIRTIGKDVFQMSKYFDDDKQMAASFSPVHNPTETNNGLYTPTSEKKNVVIIIVESFGREYIGAFNKTLEGGKYKGYTPNIDSLISKSLVFRYSFCNGRKSIDAMPSILCSIPMFVEPFVLTPASMNDYTGIAGILKERGYNSAFFHGAQRGSMGFMAFAKKIGFEDYYGREDYDADSRFGGDADFDGHWGIWDEPFLQFFCAKMTEMKEPFVTSVFTASSHHPFNIPQKYKDVYKEEQLPIHKCIRYTDMALGEFFRSAEKQPWFENTIFVLTSDHTNQSNHPEYQTDLGGFSSPIIIYDPSGDVVKPGVNDAIAQQIDIMPTILGMLNYDKPYFAFGCDLGSTAAEDTYTVNYLNGVYQYAKHGYVLQFDGTKTKAVYSLDDSLMKDNLWGKTSDKDKQALFLQMEKELKAIIQQYMIGMNEDKLRP